MKGRISKKTRYDTYNNDSKNTPTKIKTGSGNLLPDLSIQLRTLLSARFDFVVIELLSPLLRIS